MKKILFILLFLSFNFTSLFAQNITVDTIFAAENYKKGKSFYDIVKYDTASTFFQVSSDIYYKYKLWDKYLYMEAEKANCEIVMPEDVIVADEISDDAVTADAEITGSPAGGPERSPAARPPGGGCRRGRVVG